MGINYIGAIEGVESVEDLTSDNNIVKYWIYDGYDRSYHGEREQFEGWAKANGKSLERFGLGDYRDDSTFAAWIGWQARGRFDNK